MKKCLVIGSSVCDIVINLDRLPNTEEDFNVTGHNVSIGGCAFNVVSVVHNLDVPYTFLSCVGKGMYGDFVRKKLDELEVVTNISSDKENGCTYCLVDKNGERTFMAYHGIEYSFSKDWLKNLNLDEYSYIYICGIEVEEIWGEEIIDALSLFKGQIIFSPGPRSRYIGDDKLNRIYKYNPIIHLNKLELKQLMKTDDIKEAMIKYHNLTNNLIITTLGKDGCVYYDNDFHYIDGFKANIKNTIGAGDAHIGSFIACLCMNKSIDESLKIANYISSKIVENEKSNLSKNEFHSVIKIKELVDNQ